MGHPKSEHGHGSKSEHNQGSKSEHGHGLKSEHGHVQILDVSGFQVLGFWIRTATVARTHWRKLKKGCMHE